MTSFAMLSARAFAGILSVAGLLALSVAPSQGAKGFTLLYNFCQQGNCHDGNEPQSTLIADTAGNLYGTTFEGGANNKGAVFVVSPSGAETVLYSFCAVANCTDGANPTGKLALDSQGNLYGTTEVGGANGDGTVFVLARDGSETVLHSFGGGSNDGLYPDGGVILNGSDLYGTTVEGGNGSCDTPGCGTVYKVTTAGVETVLYNFQGDNAGSDGSLPYGGLVMHDRLLFGTTYQGGLGTGTVFVVSLTGHEQVLYSFCMQANCADGAYPETGLVANREGDLFGTTSAGGASGKGTVFELTSENSESVLYSFCGHANCADGEVPEAPLVLFDSALYGTTTSGGANGGGTVFRVTFDGTESVLHAFNSAEDSGASNPLGGLLHLHGYFYGTTELGGSEKGGIVYRVGSDGG